MTVPGPAERGQLGRGARLLIDNDFRLMKAAGREMEGVDLLLPKMWDDDGRVRLHMSLSDVDVTAAMGCSPASAILAVSVTRATRQAAWSRSPRPASRRSGAIARRSPRRASARPAADSSRRPRTSSITWVRWVSSSGGWRRRTTK